MFGFYSDPAMTTPLTLLSLLSLFDGSSGEAVTGVVYFGNPASGKLLLPAEDAAIEISVTDSASGTGLPASAVKLALTEAGLASATPGAALSLGASRTSGAGNQVEVWVAVDTGAAPVGDYLDLGLVTNSIVEASL